MKKSCSNCKYRKRNAFKDPCLTGILETPCGTKTHCPYWKPYWIERIKIFIDRFTDPLEYIRLKCILIMLCCLTVILMDRRF